MEIISLDQLDLDKSYTYEDYLTWQFNERTELINGKIHPLSSSPGTQHQLVLGEIFFHISNYLRQSTSKIFIAPFDVRLPSNANLYPAKILPVVLRISV